MPDDPPLLLAIGTVATAAAHTVDISGDWRVATRGKHDERIGLKGAATKGRRLSDLTRRKPVLLLKRCVFGTFASVRPSRSHSAPIY